MRQLFKSCLQIMVKASLAHYSGYKLAGFLGLGGWRRRFGFRGSTIWYRVEGIWCQEFGLRRAQPSRSWNAACDELSRVECGKKEKAQCKT